MPEQITLTAEEAREYFKTKKLPSKNKYNAKRVEYNGRNYDSTGEMEYYRDCLELLEKAGEIGKVKFQHRYELEVNGQHVCYYYADFRYKKDGRFYIVDFKSEHTMKDRNFINKWKMLKATVMEVEVSAVLQLVLKKGGVFVVVEETIFEK